MTSRTSVAGVYSEVIKDVVDKVREKFLNEGVDEQVLQELKQLWTAKVHQTNSVSNWDSGVPSGRPAYAQAAKAQAAKAHVPTQHVQLKVDGGQFVQLPVATDQMLASQFPGFGVAKAPQTDGSKPEVPRKKPLPQLDGANEDSSTSSSEDEENEQDEEGRNSGQDKDEGEPLGPGDDVESEEEFDTENVVVCQFERVGRMRNRWKFQLRDGIMNLEGKDYIFHKATGEAEW